MDIHDVIFVLRGIGLKGIAHTIQYGFSRDKLDKKFLNNLTPSTRYTPGNLISTLPIKGGIRVGFDNAQVEVFYLSEDVVKVEWKPGKNPCPYLEMNPDWESPNPTIQSNPSGFSLRYGNLDIFVNDKSCISFKDLDGNILRKDNPPILEGNRWSLSTDLAPEEHIYGLGERAFSLNLRPGRYCSWNTDVGGTYSHGKDPLYIGSPIYLSLSNSGSCLVLFTNTYQSTFEIGDTLNATFSGGMLSYFIFFGTLETIFGNLSYLIGGTSMPPRWVLGYHQSRWGYRTEIDIRRVIKGFEDHKLPLSAIHLDIDYMDGFRLFTVNKNHFPNLKRLTSDLNEKGIYVVASINPAVKIDQNYTVYRDGLSKDVFCKLPDGKILRGVSWPGWSVFPDFTNPKARIWWQEQYKAILSEGIAGIWHDMNEPVSFAAWGDKTFPISTSHDMEGRVGNHLEAHNIYGSLMNWAGYSAMLDATPNKRPWILSRSGWAGLQGYAWNWTGDIETSWKALQQTIPTILGLGISGQPFSGVDIGGFSGSPDAELYLRWFQLATFLPLFRTHSSISTNQREPWVFGEPTTSIIRNFLELRYKLITYLYTLTWDATRTKIPLVRPIFWENPRDANLWDVDDEFLLGDSLLIAPVIHENETKRQVIFPGGSWYSLWDDQKYVIPGPIELSVFMEMIPVFIKAGTLLSMEEDGKLYFHIYPDFDNSSANHIYIDAGDGYGPWRADTFHTSPNKNSLAIAWSNEGEYPFPYPKVTVQLHGKQLTNAIADGNACRIQGNSINIPKFHELHLSFDD